MKLEGSVIAMGNNPKAAVAAAIVAAGLLASPALYVDGDADYWEE